MTEISVNIETADRADLVAARDRIIDELRRRETLANASAVIERELKEYKRAAGRSDGQPWRPYDGSLDSMYAVGEIVIHNSRVWKSLINQNVWEPGTAEGLWEELTGEAPTPDPVEATVWEPGQQVSAGDLREFEGAIYRAVQAHTTQQGWEPPLVPALWSLIQEATEA